MSPATGSTFAENAKAWPQTHGVCLDAWSFPLIVLHFAAEVALARHDRLCGRWHAVYLISKVRVRPNQKRPTPSQEALEALAVVEMRSVISPVVALVGAVCHAVVLISSYGIVLQ